MKNDPCLIVEDEQAYRSQFARQVQECTELEVEAPKNLDELQLVLVQERQRKLVILDGSLWDGETWIKYVKLIRKQLAPDGVIVCVSSTELVARAMERFFRPFRVLYAGKQEGQLLHVLGQLAL